MADTLAAAGPRCPAWTDISRGETTVFNPMTGLHAPVGFGGEVRLGAVRVPDERIDALSRIFSPKKTTAPS